MTLVLNSNLIETPWLRPSIPRQGMSLSKVTEERAVNIRKAVELLRSELRCGNVDKLYLRLFGPRWQYCDLTPSNNLEPIFSRAAWSLVAMRTIGRLTGSLLQNATFYDTEKWFWGNKYSSRYNLSSLITEKALNRIIDYLEQTQYDKDFSDLLPYILEPHGPGSRMSVKRDPKTKKARRIKKDKGVFYTPSDVAEYMVKELLEDNTLDLQSISCLDPACGSGVFLRTILRFIKESIPKSNGFDIATRSLYGFDISPLAIEMACFVLLHDCYDDILGRGIALWNAWHLLRLNFAAVDSISVLPNESYKAILHKHRPESTKKLLAGNLDSCTKSIAEKKTCYLGEIFPEIHDGFDVLIGNPPYATIGYRDNIESLIHNYSCLNGGLKPSCDIYPLFIEMMWKFTKKGCGSASLVVPLSIAYHQGKQFVSCRTAIAEKGGDWKFAFFDREPHALFGEDVKTRNAIIFRRDHSTCKKERSTSLLIKTGPLNKWTSRNRQSLFSSINFTPLKNNSIEYGVPKLDGELQEKIARDFFNSQISLSDSCQKIYSCKPECAFHNSLFPSVYVSSTAYNFLNVFRHHRISPPEGKISENPVKVLALNDEDEAMQVFSILSSRLIYWWWIVTGDGFHVTSKFIKTLPFATSCFSSSQRVRLASYGRILWEKLQDQVVVSCNNGRKSIAYRPFSCEKVRDSIDSLLLSSKGYDPTLREMLRDIVRNKVIVDTSDLTRNQYKLHFR